jgi:hypothetical protein
LKGFVLLLAKYVFYLYAWLWCLGRRRVETTVDVLNLFYLDFLRLDRRDVEVVKLDERELVTRCRNRCPILNLSLRLGVDTRLACRVISEPVCRYVLNRLNPSLVFERNYNHIRPYADSCEERIYFRC